jgi:DNA-binding beta-propeller fold protein YncE
VYVADYLNTRVDKFDAAGEYLAQWSVPDIPLGITVDATENVFVSLWTLSRIEKYSSSGTLLDEFGGLGAGDGQFNEPWGLQFDTNQDLVIADNNNNRIQKLSPSGAFLVGWGAGPGTGNCQPGSFNSPYDVAIGPQGWIYVADTGCRRIQVFEEGTLSVSDRLAMQGGVRVWPVPFRQGSLSVTFHTPPGIGARSEVQVRDLAGRLVRTIADARRDAGSHGLSWDGKDERGRLLPTGIYCLSVRAGGQSQNVKVVVLR